MTLKYSRQREAIKKFLMTRDDHPTADVVYSNVRTEFPNISLGTVYLSLIHIYLQTVHPDSARGIHSRMPAHPSPLPRIRSP